MPAPSVAHFSFVDKTAIRAQFFDCRRHRATLFLPFVGRETGKVLCVIGQNPSAADEHVADKTIHYLEKLVYCMHPEYSGLLILNLYSRVDTTKSATDGLLHRACDDLFNRAVGEHEDFLLVYGKLRNQGAYKFPDRAEIVLDAIKGKRVFQLDIGTTYPPHPGNRQILYQNFSVSFAPVDVI